MAKMLTPDEKARRAEETKHEARSVVDADLEQARKKTARLREERLAKEAREGVTERDNKRGKRRR